MQRLDKKELAALRKEVRAEIKEIKSDIKAAEKSDEFSRKVDRLYDRLEGNELLLDAIDMAVQEMSGQRLSDADWDELVSAFRDAVEFADSNKASFDSRDVLDRVLVSNANESVIKESYFDLKDRSEYYDTSLTYDSQELKRSLEALVHLYKTRERSYNHKGIFEWEEKALKLCDSMIKDLNGAKEFVNALMSEYTKD